MANYERQYVYTFENKFINHFTPEYLLWLLNKTYEHSTLPLNNQNNMAM